MVGPLWSPAALWPVLGGLYAMRQLQHEAVLRLFETCYRDLPGKASEAAAQVKLCMGVFFDFVVWVFRRVS